MNMSPTGSSIDRKSLAYRILMLGVLPTLAGLVIVWSLSLLSGGWIFLLPGRMFELARDALKALGFQMTDSLAYLLLLLTGAISGLLIGVFAVGLPQWIILRRWVPWASSWVAVTGVGWAVSGALFAALGSIAGNTMVVRYIIITVLIISSTGLGLVQWLFLRRQVRGAGVWLLATILGWGLSLVADRLIGLMLFESEAYRGWPVGYWPLVWVVAGLITGSTLALLIARRPTP
jgi:hypothetical protein